jgi:hypothetical protein
MFTSAACLAVLAPAGVSSRHHFYPYVSAAQLAGPGRPELPHPAEPDMTFDTPWAGPGTARADVAVGPVDPVSWDGSERYGSYGPNLFGD